MTKNHHENIGGHPYGDYERHKVLVHFGYSFGGFILTAVVDYLFLWPDNHLAALLAMAAWLSVTAIVELTVWGYSPWATASVVIGLFAGVGAINWIIGPIHAPEVEVVGSLQPGNEPTPPNGCDSMPAGMVAPDALKILIASNAYFRNGLGKITAIEIGADPNTCKVLTMERTAIGIDVSAELYGATGQYIARISGGEFHEISGEHSYVERQGDLSTLVVKDGSGKELLYVRYLNPTTVRARGVFGCPGHTPVAFTDDGAVGATAIITNSCVSAGRAAIRIQ